MSIHLVMIVKNAESTIENTINAISSFINEYTIVDTGSTDNTINIIKNSLHNKKGKLYNEKFIDFSTNRNQALEYAEKENTSKYFLMLDDSYIVMNMEGLLNYLKDNTTESLSVCVKNDSDNISYYSSRLFLVSSKIRYKYKVHEIPMLKENSKIIPVEISYIVDYHTINTIERSKKRYKEDIKWLLEDLNQNYTNEEKDRFNYYIGRTYYALNEYDDAVKYFWKVQFEYKYSALYYLANILCNQNKFKDAEMIFLLCIKEHPHRAESYYKLALEYYLLFNSKGSQGMDQYSDDDYLTKAYEILKKAINIKMPKNETQEVEMNIYTKEIPYLFAEICMLKKDFTNAIRSIQQGLLNNEDDIRFHNILYSISDHEKNDFIELHKPLIVFHATNNILWSPENVHQVGSGSEIMVMNLAKMLVQKGFKVFVFGKFIAENVSYENVYDGVEYMDHSRYNEICSNYKINVLIVSRDPKNLLFYDNIDQVYLWLHDIQPIEPFFQVHRTKFRGVMCLSNWHKNKFINEFKFLKDAVIVTHNAIDLSRFNVSSVVRQDKRFIYTSSPDRGLDTAVEMFKDINVYYPHAKLHIFCDKSKIEQDLLETIKSNSNIILNDRCSQEQLAIEYLKSEIWFYPCHFDETYCISALEAQAAGCLCVSVNRGSLNEIIGHRGILVNGDIYKKEVQKELINKLLYVFKNKKIYEFLIKKSKEWSKTQTYENLINEWIKLFGI